MAGLKGRTLPAAFFEKAKYDHLRSPARSNICEVLSNTSSVSSASWNVCVFLDLRTSSENDVPLVLLPIPEEECLFMHYYNHFQACKRIFALIQPQHFNLFTKWLPPTNMTLVSTDIGIPYAISVKSIRDAYNSHFDSETITLCWNSCAVIEHQLLWKPSTDVYETVSFIGDNNTPIALAWRNSCWKDYPIATASKTLKCSQRVWNLTNEKEYLEYIFHKFGLLGWK